jgi:hypothetical protein
MKQVLLNLLLLVSYIAGYAQNCAGYYYLQQHKTITMSVFDRKNKPSGTYAYKISDVKQSPAVTSSVVKGEFMDEKGKILSRSVCLMKCSGGNFQMDMKMLLPQQQAEQFKHMDVHTESYLDYPAGMHTGDVLKDGSFTANTKTDNGLEMNIEMNVTDRVVGGEEEVVTPAGTWKCFKITSKCRFRTRVSGIGIPFQIDNTEWFAPAFGIIKTGSKWGSTIITSIQ